MINNIMAIDKQVIVGDGGGINQRLAELEGRFKIILRLGIDEFGLSEGRLNFKSIRDVKELFNLAELKLTEDQLIKLLLSFYQIECWLEDKVILVAKPNIKPDLNKLIKIFS